jgi:peptidoglycan/xylan/chitin deacetylase (PgdA/CDA1 family)
MEADLTVRATIPPMNTDKPTPAPEDSTSAEAVPADDSAEPTVALSKPGDAGDGEPTAVLPAAETSEPTAVLSSPVGASSAVGAGPTADLPSSAGAEPTADLSSSAGAEPAADLSADSPAAESVSEGESEATVTLSAAEIADAAVEPSRAETAEEAVALSAEEEAVAPPAGEEGEATVALLVGERGEATVGLPAGEEGGATVAPPAGEEGEATVALLAGEEGEATVALLAGEEADETVAFSAGEGVEETVAFSVGELAAGVAAASAADESEPTTVISAGAEPTVALPKPRISPESKVALPVSRESSSDPEPTTALLIPAKPAPRPAAESKVTWPSVPAQRPAPTVTPPPSEPTIALPAAPGVPPVVLPPVKPLTRRRLLWAIPAVAGTALVGGTIAALAGRDEPEATKAPNLVVTEPAPTQASTPTPTTPQPTTVVMKEPVHTLQDFRKVVPGDPFPADAIALTIDDGPHPVWTPAILRLLEKHHVPALFCMIGNQVLGHETIARDVATDGHRIANHTWSHPINLAKLPSHKMLKELHRAQDKIYSTTGYAPSLFRSPGGAWSKGLSEAVSKSNVIPMDWTTDPRDWARPGVAQITNRLLAAKPGQILLCHDGGGDRSQTLASLKTVIPALQAKGLKFVALM